jgi:hypothetical protein
LIAEIAGLPQPILKIGNDLCPVEYGQGPFHNKIDEKNDNGFLAILFINFFEEIENVHSRT